MKKTFLFMMIALAVGSISAQQTSDTLKSLKTFDAKLPIYHQGRLQIFVYSREVEKHADKVTTIDPVIDLIRRGINVDDIKYMENVKPYPLDSPPLEVAKFWAGIIHSDGLIMTSQATLDTDNQTAFGDRKVYFRSPMLDLNGVGFKANFANRAVEVTRDVHIRIRMASLDSKKKNPSLSAEPIIASGDSLFLDFKNNIIILEGNVKIDESRFAVTCDRVELNLNEDDTPAKPAAETPAPQVRQGNDRLQLDGLGGGQRALSKVTCSGNVVIERKLTDQEKKNGEQKATAGNAVFDVKKDEIVLTGNEPTIRRGSDKISGDEITIWHNSERMRANRNCQIILRRPQSDGASAPGLTTITSEFMDMNMSANKGDFIGNVQVTDQGVRLNCHQMALKFADREGAKEELKKQVADGASPELGSLGGSKELTAITCSGKVEVTREGQKGADGKLEPDSKALAGQLDYDARKNLLVFSKDNPTMTRGGDSVSGDQIAIWLNEQRMELNRNAKIVAGTTPATPAASPAATAKPKAKSILRANYSDLNYGSGVLTFTGNVKVRDPKLTLDCGKLLIFLKEAPDATPKQKDVKNAPKQQDLLGGNPLELMAQNDGGRKELEKIVCENDVHLDDPKGTLDCDMLTLYFEPVPGGKKTTAIDSSDPMQALGNSEVTRLTSVGNVKFVGKDQPKTPENTKKAPSGNKLADKASEQAAFSSKTQVFADRADMEMKRNFGTLEGNVKMIDPQGTLTCQKMDFYLKKASETPIAKTEAEDNEGYEYQLPERISIGFGKELERIVALRDVRLVRILPDEKQGATAERAEYVVAKKKLTMTGTPEKLPTLERNDGIWESRTIIFRPEDETLEGEGGMVRRGSVNPGSMFK